MNTKLRNAILGVAAAGLIFGATACSRDPKVHFVSDEAIAGNINNMSKIQLELEKTYDLMKKRGSVCVGKKEFVMSGLQYFNDTNYYSINEISTLNAPRFHGTILRNITLYKEPEGTCR